MQLRFLREREIFGEPGDSHDSSGLLPQLSPLSGASNLWRLLPLIWRVSGKFSCFYAVGGAAVLLKTSRLAVEIVLTLFKHENAPSFGPTLELTIVIRGRQSP